ncbi:MAG: BREX-1 system adenine-specific DNA-methyltransferase PglX, partial [Methylococcales bacterium]|nr:BREX-1 system adenine-specific DNA-methyltransferase PglX [Methylococcales bacterium]
IYEEQGYEPRTIPRLILEKNLYGLDIDDRAAQLAGFALLMKARADDRRIFVNPPKLNILALVESGNCEAPRENAVLEPFYTQLIELFKHAKTFGSLIQIPANLAAQLPAMEAHLRETSQQGDLLSQLDAMNLLPLVEQAHILAMKFDAVIANPPYMGGKYLNPLLKEYLKKHYKGFEKDLFSAFMIRDLDFTKESGQLGFMSPFVWMFISSYEELRTHFIDNATLTSLIQLEYSGFDGATVPICTFTLAKAHIQNYTGSYIKLSDFKGHENQAPKTLEAIKNRDCGWFYNAKPDDFKKISGSPVAYWVSDKVRDVYANHNKIYECSISEGQNITADNDKYLRLFWEVDFPKIKPAGKWSFYAKGGSYRKWFGNLDYVVDWSDEARKNYHSHNSARIIPKYLRFREGITWSLITSSHQSYRLLPDYATFDKGGSSIFFNDFIELKKCLLFLNTKISAYLTKISNASLNLQVDDVRKLPFSPSSIDLKIDTFDKLIDIAKTDWNNYETAWDFTENPLIRQQQPTLKAAFEQWQTQNRAAIVEMQRLEEENNRLFIEAYGLQDELTPDVPEEQITLVCADLEKDCRDFISYAVGCLFGR